MKQSKRPDFEKQIKDGADEMPVYLVQCKDQDERRAAWEGARPLLLKDEDSEAAVQSFDGERVSTSQLMAELQSLPFFQKRLIIRVTQAEKLKKDCQEAMISYLSSPTPNIMLYLEAAGLRSNTRLYKSCDQEGLVLDIPEEKPWEKERRMRDWLQGEARKEGYELKSDAATTLVQQIGCDRQLLLNELEKLVCYCSGRKQITNKDLAAVSTTTPQDSIWELGTAIFTGKRGKAIASMDTLLRQGLALPMLLRGLRKQFQTEFQVCSILHHGGTPGDVMKAFPYMRGKILEQHVRQAQSFGMDRFKRGIVLIDKAELLIKNSDTSAENCLIPLLGKL